MAHIQINYFSNALEMNTLITAIIPNTTPSGQSFPTLFLLHGMGGDHTSWLRRTSIERYVEDKNLAVVMPTTQLGWYVNTLYGIQYEQYVAQELPAYCRSLFRGMSDRREDTYIAGLSMGGYGAFYSALRHPETFCAAASLSGALDLEDDILQHEKKGEEMRYWRGLFGETAQLPGSKYDLFTQAEKCKAGGLMPKLYHWCGTEDRLLNGGRRFRDHAQALGYDLIYRESEGNHNWVCWDREIQSVLQWIDEIRGNVSKGE